MSDLWRVVVTLVASIVFGLVFMVAGGVGVWYELTHPPAHTTHVWLFFSTAVFGALMLPAIGGVMLNAAKSALGVAGPYLPFGRRAYDNPPKDPP